MRLVGGDGCFDGGAILVFEEGDFCDVLVLRVSGCITNLGGGGGCLDGGVIPVFEGGNLLQSTWREWLQRVSHDRCYW